MLNTFGEIPTGDEIFIPSEPLGVRNNCQAGQWTLGEESLGKKLNLIALSYRQFFGDLGKTTDTYWGELYFYPVGSINFPPCVMRTYFKSVGLKNFNALITATLARGKNPAHGIFSPEFQSKSGTNAKGEPISYYILAWTWQEAEPNDNELFTKLATAINGYSFPAPNEGNLILLPSDGAARDNAIAQFKASKQQQLAPQNQQQLASANPF